MTIPNPRQFYDALAAEYHLLFADWQQAIHWQGEVIDALIRRHWQGNTPARTILDCTCGIGTQALGLARLGYSVAATDLSEASVEVARQQAQAMGLSIRFDVADIRTLAETVAGTYDVVITFDNALPHLREADLRRALAQIKLKVAEGGWFMASIRDYDALIVERPRQHSRRDFEDADGRRTVHQEWEWSHDGSQYIVNQYIEREGDTHPLHYATTYYPLLREELSLMLIHAGFIDTQWLMPAVSSYYQPVVIAQHLIPELNVGPYGPIVMPV